MWEGAKSALPTRPAARHEGEERRSHEVREYGGAERRRVGPATGLMTVPEYADGWLVFDSGEQKRRLAPPPPEWDSCAEARLAELWRAAADTTEPHAQ